MVLKTKEVNFMKASSGNSLLNNDVDMIINNLGDISFQDKKVLVTGGAGFLGSWTCDVLVNQGANVTCFDNLSSGLSENISHLEQDKNFTFVKRDVIKPFQVKDKIDLVMHMASRASPFEFDKFPLEILQANTLGLLNALEIARENQAKFLFTSTSEVYGNPSKVPTPESYYGNVNPIGIRGCYDEGKRCGEAYVMAYKKQYNMNTRIARIFNTYGPRMRSDGIYGRVAPRFIAQALDSEPITIFGDGKQTRSFCYITDQIEGLLRLVSSEKAAGEVVNIGNDDEFTILELADEVINMTGSNSKITFSPLPEDDPLRRCPDITRARDLIDWYPKVRLKEGIRKTIEWKRSFYDKQGIK
jgi:UDP-glucuronate decarboxylase